MFTCEEQAAIEFGFRGHVVNPGVLSDQGCAVAAECGGHFGPVHGAGFAIVGGFDAGKDGVQVIQVGRADAILVAGGAGAAEEVGDDTAGAVLAATGLPDVLEGGGISKHAAVGGWRGDFPPDAAGEAGEGFDVVAVAHLTDAALFEITQFQVVNAAHAAQHGERQGKDDAVITVGGGAFVGEEFEAEFAIDVLNGAEALAESDVGFGSEFGVEGIGERGVPACDAVGFVTVPKNLEAFAGVRVDEIDQVQAGLAFGLDAELWLISGDEEADGPRFHALGVLVEVIGKGNLVEPSSFLGEVAVGVVEAVGIGGNALAEGAEGGAHGCFGADLAVKPVVVVAGVALEQVLQFKAEFLGETDQVLVVGIDEFGTEFDELAVGVEVFAREDAASAALGSLKQMHGPAFLGQTISGGETGDAATDDGDWGC